MEPFYDGTSDFVGMIFLEIMLTFAEINILYILEFVFDPILVFFLDNGPRFGPELWLSLGE